MLNYIRAELYKAVHRVYTWIMLALVFLGEGFIFVIWIDNRKYMDFFDGVIIIGQLMIFGFIATIFTCDIVFAGQHQNGTLKNEVSFGLSRAKIYWGKFIAMTILSVLAMVIALGVYIGVCRIMLPDYAPAAAYYAELDIYDGGGALTALQLVGLGVLTELPVWLGCQAIICAASFLLPSVIAANVVAIGIVAGSPFAVEFLWRFIRDSNPLADFLPKLYYWLPFQVLTTRYPGVAELHMGPTRAITGIDWMTIYKGWIIGGFWLIFATAVGLYFFRKKEIK